MSLDFSVSYEGWFKPYYMFSKLNVESAEYFGHKWFLLVHVGWWEFVLCELC